MIDAEKVFAEWDAAEEIGESGMARRLRELAACDAERNDKEYSRLFAKCVCDRVALVSEERKYRRYNGTIWQSDPSGDLVMRDAKEFSDALLEYGIGLPDGKEKSGFVEYASRYAKFTARSTLVKDSRSELVASRSAFDARPELLNLANGTLDTDTMEFQPHSAADMLTRFAPTAYDPSARCPEWERFISDALMGDAEAVRYVQKQFGVAVTCDTSQERMHIFHGPTRSGKSTALETLSAMLGGSEEGYARAVQWETLAQKQARDGAKQSADVARLAGCRLAVVAEPDKGMLFDAARLKQMTGRDTITARFLNENPFQFVPVYSVFMHTNHLPAVNDRTLFESGRLVVVEFPRHLEEAERDLGLKDRLAKPEALSGLLNWCLEGLSAYRAEGAEPPASVVRATEAYADDSDKVKQFFADRMERCEDASESRFVYEEYVGWCQESGLHPEGIRTFRKELRARGLLEKRGYANGRDTSNVIPGWKISRKSVFPGQ